MKLPSILFAACSVLFNTAALASATFTDDFSQPEGGMQDWLVLHPAVSVQGQTLFFAPTGVVGNKGEPTALVGLSHQAIEFESINSISFDLTYAGFTHGGVLFCAQTASDRWEATGYVIDYYPGKFRFYTVPEFATQEFPDSGDFEGRWRIDFSVESITFSVNGQEKFAVRDSTYRSGIVGFWCYFSEGQEMFVDNVKITHGGPYATGRVLRVARDTSGSGDGSSWADAYPELWAALDASNEGDELWVAGGAYTPTQEQSSTFLLKSGVALYGGFAGTETKREDRDPTRNVTILSGDIDASKPFGDLPRHDHVVTLGDETILDGFTVTGGRADGVDADGAGAGILVAGLGASVSSVEVRQNQARQGSGAFILPGGGAQFTNVLFAENLSGEGGTVYCSNGSVLGLLNSTIASNLAAAGSAGLRIEAGSTQTITNSIVWNGGGGEALSLDEGASPAIAYSLIEGAQAPAGPGNLNGDPLFRRPARRDDHGTPEDPTDDLWIPGNYKLFEVSPAINSGLASGAPKTDILGVPRPCGVGVDMGAYEYCEPPDFYVKLPDAEVTLGERFQVRVQLDFDHNPDTPAPAAVEGWSYGVCHDPAVLKPVSVSWVGSDTAGIHGGQGPEFVGVRLPGDLPSGAQNGVTIGVVVDYSPPFDSRLPATNGWRDALITYEVVNQSMPCAHAGDTKKTQISVCDTLDSPRVRVVMTVNSESLPATSFDSATVTLRCPTLFRRGDSTQDGFVDISDAICILSGLFGFDASSSCLTKVPECLKAIDVNDDGSADITDPINLLTALFGQPPPIPPLTGNCQYDPTEDSLGCQSYPPCQ